MIVITLELSYLYHVGDLDLILMSQSVRDKIANFICSVISYLIKF